MKSLQIFAALMIVAGIVVPGMTKAALLQTPSSFGGTSNAIIAQPVAEIPVVEATTTEEVLGAETQEVDLIAILMDQVKSLQAQIDALKIPAAVK